MQVDLFIIEDKMIKMQVGLLFIIDEKMQVGLLIIDDNKECK